MGRVLTNNIGLAYTIETALGVAGTSWFLLEPNGISTFGAEITTVARDPISPNRQRRKGTVTDLDSNMEFEHDITLSVFQDFIEGFCFANAINIEMDIPVTNVDGVNDEFDVAALSATQADKLQWVTGDHASLIHGKGFLESANNGLHALSADPLVSGTAIEVGTDLVDETPPANAEINIAGWRFLDAATDTVSFSYSAPTLTIDRSSSTIDFTTLGLTAGQLIHVGSPDGSGGIQNALQDSVANDTYGYARIVSIAAGTITCDKVDTTLQVASPTEPATVDVLFGKFIRNVSVSDADYLERSFQFEMEFPNLDTGGNNEYQYSLGNYCNTVSFELPLTDKAICNFGFIGTDTEDPVVAGSRKSGASTAQSPNETVAFNTTADIARLRITDTDETGLTTFFKSITLTFNNNVSPEKVLGQLGAAFLNTGNFEVDVESQLLFTEGLVIDRIRANATVTMDFVITNDNGAIAVDVPAMTLGDGSREFPVNESVLINTTAQAFEDTVLGTSIGVSIFPIVP